MRNQQRHSGQSLLEFALLLPLLLLMVMGLFDIGRAIFYYAVLNTAVREGTRFAIVQPYEDYGAYPEEDGLSISACASGQCAANENICNEIQDKTFNISELSDSRLSITHGENPSQDPILISLRFDYQPITPGLGLIGDFTIEVDSQMLMTPKSKGGG